MFFYKFGKGKVQKVKSFVFQYHFYFYVIFF
jgi:hypothetical protein